MTIERMNELRCLLRHHNHAYHNLDAAEISNEQYDGLFRELLNLEERYPDHFDPLSPTQRVGGDTLPHLDKFEHIKPMLSLDNAFSPKETEDKISKIIKQCDDSSILNLVGELKLDGLAVSLYYKDGLLVSAATRGGGLVGENVLHNVLTISSVPTHLPRGVGKFLEVRGEVVMHKSVLKAYNDARPVNMALKNPRNAAAGSLRKLNPKECRERRLNFYPYAVGHHEGFNLPDSQFDRLQFLKENGFILSPLIRKINSLQALESFHDEVLSIRDDLDIEIDGLVFKLDSLTMSDKVGYDRRAPKYAFARKFPSLEVETLLRDVTFSVGRTGAISPVAVLDTVFIGGVDVSSANLYNEDEITRLGVAIGDVIKLKRVGDVIPRIVSVSEHGTNRQPIVFPKECPCCHAPIKRNDDEAKYVCTNPYTCESQFIERLSWHVSIKCMNIIGVGGKLVQQLVEHKMVQKLEDLYLLTPEMLVLLPKVGKITAQNTIQAIEASKTTTYVQFLTSLGILGLGEGAALSISRNLQNIEDFMQADYETLISIPDVGFVTTENILSFTKSEEGIRCVKSLMDAGIHWPETISGTTLDLSGLTFVVTGSFDAFSRKELESALKASGAKVSGSISKKTSVLIQGEGGGGKLSKAQALKDEGIPISIMDEVEFLSSEFSSLIET
ncbi:NAD-dependent DNA ligase LigA [Vibrio splendidus]